MGDSVHSADHGAVVPVVAEDKVPFDSYWRMRMDGAESRLNAVREIVTHPGTRGDFAEALLRETIAEFLPQRYAVATGFIMDRPQSSNQIDIIIYDQLTDAPVFRDGGFVILTPGSAKVAIEVKSKLTHGENGGDLEAAFDNIRSLKKVDDQVFGLIFGYDGNQKDTFVEHAKNWGNGADPVDRTLWPDRVYNLKHRFMMSPELGTTAESGHLLTTSRHNVYNDATIVRMFLTAVLQSLNVANLRSVMPADPILVPSDAF